VGPLNEIANVIAEDNEGDKGKAHREKTLRFSCDSAGVGTIEAEPLAAGAVCQRGGARGQTHREPWVILPSICRSRPLDPLTRRELEQRDATMLSTLTTIPRLNSAMNPSSGAYLESKGREDRRPKQIFNCAQESKPAPAAYGASPIHAADGGQLGDPLPQRLPRTPIWATPR